MIEEPKTVIEENSELHPDILYSTLIAININMATVAMGNGDKTDITAMALSTSAQLPNVIAMASSLILCIRPLILNKTIKFKEAIELMYDTRPAINEQMTKEEAINFFEKALDLPSSKLILDS